MSSNDPLLLLRVNRIVSDITARVNTSAVEILEIVSKYEDELRLAKEEIERQRKLLEAVVVPKQHSTTQTLASDVQCSELHLSVCEQTIPPEQLQDELFLAKEEIERQRKLLEAVVPKQHSTTQTLTSDVQCSELHLSVCEQTIPPEQLLGDKKALESNKPHLSVFSLTSQQFVALTKSLETDKKDDPYSCHGGDEYGRPLEAYDFVSQVDLVQIKEEEEPMSIHVGEEGCQSTLDATEATSDSSQSFKTEKKILSVHLHRVPCMEDCNGDGRPSGPEQQRKEKLPSPRQHVATSHESRGDQGGKQSLLDTTSHTRKSKRKPACDSNTDLQKLSLLPHIQSHSRTTCPICQRNFASSSMKRHMLIHTGEKQYSCNVCGNAFSRRDHLKSHMSKHTRNKPTHTCSTCGKQFGLKRVLQRHQKRCILKGEKSVSERPKKIHTGEKSLSDQRKKVHTGEKSPLETRKKIHTGEKSTLERRKKIKTEEKSPSERPKKIKTEEKSPSERPKKIHTGEKSLSVSRKGFNRSSNKNAHRAKLAGQKIQPKFCTICQKYLYSQIKRHMLIHTGEKPYGCEFCGKHYQRSDHLKKHICGE